MLLNYGIGLYQKKIDHSARLLEMVFNGVNMEIEEYRIKLMDLVDDLVTHEHTVEEGKIVVRSHIKINALKDVDRSPHSDINLENVQKLHQINKETIFNFLFEDALKILEQTNKDFKDFKYQYGRK